MENSRNRAPVVEPLLPPERYLTSELGGLVFITSSHSLRQMGCVERPGGEESSTGRFQPRSLSQCPAPELGEMPGAQPDPVRVWDTGRCPWDRISSREGLLSPAEGPCGVGSSRQVWGHPSSLSPRHFEGPVPPARGCPHGFVAVLAGVTCSPRGVLGPLEMEDGEERQEHPQEVPGQRCGEPEGEGGRMRAGPGPAPRRPAPPAPYPRRPAPGRPCCGSRRPRSA